MTAAPPREPRVHDWGSAPDLYGPRHEYREAILLRRLLPALPGPRVLNAGCGAGSLTLRLADAGLEVTSIDASPAFVEHVAGLVAERHPGRDLPVRRGDVQALDVAEGAFDAAVCAEVLEHLDDDLAALRGLRRALRPGGVLAVTVPAGPWRYSWVDLWAGHRRRYDAPGLRGRLEQAGFARAEVASWGFPVTALYERVVYRPMLRRRLARGGGTPAGPGRAARLAAPVVRAALEVDGLAGGRGPGLGLVALAWT